MSKNQVMIKRDRYRSVRGGQSRILDVSCEECREHVVYYQKDGPGSLKRMYLDRIIPNERYKKFKGGAVKDIPKLKCPKCKQLIGVPFVYRKEKRLAFRLFQDAITKKIIKQKDLPQ